MCSHRISPMSMVYPELDADATNVQSDVHSCPPVWTAEPAKKKNKYIIIV